MSVRISRQRTILLTIIFLLTAMLMQGIAQDTSRTLPAHQSIPDTLLFKIQKAQSVISEIKAANKRGYGISRIRNGLAGVRTNIEPIAADLKTTRALNESKSLTNYSLILTDAQTKLTAWQTTLAKSNNDLQGLLDQVLTLSSDSLLAVNNRETTGKQLYTDQLVNLKLQLQEAGDRTTARLDTVSRLLADVSGTLLTINSLQTSISERLQKSKENALQKESPYLWEAPVNLSVQTLLTVFNASFQGQDQILSYFFASSWDSLFLLILLTGLFFFRIFTSFKTARRSAIRPKITGLHLVNLTRVPVVASLIFLLNLAPLFEPLAPSLYIEAIILLLYVILTIHLWKRLTPENARLWVTGGVLYALLFIANAVVRETLFMRLGLILLNAASLYIGLAFARRLPRYQRLNRVKKLVTKLFLILHTLAIVLNLFGRISLAKAFSMTASAGLIQIIGLSIFIDILLEALALQITISTAAQGLFSRINVAHIQRSFKKGLTIVAIIIWLLVFFNNLGLADSLFNVAFKLLTRSRGFGSISFTLSNVLSFSVIIYLSSLLQKNIGLLFGESQLPTADERVASHSSVLALVRLAIIIAGVLLAIAASGISIDKFTVVLGALSVGIGLGMQNIVSNFVSGIILVFEKPFKIGDFVELADKKGRIREIGIRSSKMLTAQGSEVIIPNGDFIANRIVNWTSNETFLKTEIPLKINAATDMQTVRSILAQEVAKLDGALKNRAPEVFITTIGPDVIELKVQIWISNIYTETALKSRLLEQLLSAFKAAGIQLV